jgi:hypothetical protein
MCELLAAESRRLGRQKPPVAISTVSKWENGRCWPDAWHAQCLCSLLDTTPAALGLEVALSADRPNDACETESARLSSILLAVQALLDELKAHLHAVPAEGTAAQSVDAVRVISSAR